MSELAVTIRDANRSVYGQVHGSVVDKLVAALSADPETIEELQAAVLRFVPPDESSPIAHFRRGEDDEPYDAGVCIIDLAARYVAYESSYSSLGASGTIHYIDHQREIEAGLPFHLADDWFFDHAIDSWRATADERRRRRQAVPRIDARAVLYDRLAPFVAEQCLGGEREDVSPDGAWTPPLGWSLQALPERAKPDAPPSARDAAAEIHARWLMTPREDLQGRTPREVLLAGQGHIEWDLQDRGHQWSMLRECPPGIAVDSAAYRFGGFGTQEYHLYYDLVRHLVAECWDRVVQRSQQPVRAGLYQPGVSFEALVGQLRQSQREWSDAAQTIFVARVTPAEIIAQERQRIPYALTGRAAMVDCDCPMCQMMADSGPMFIGFDGCNNDDDFPFTRFATREHWEEAEWERKEFNREFEEEEKLRKTGLLEEDDWAPLNADCIAASGGWANSIWQRSFSAPETPNDDVSLQLFGIACHLGELVTDLKDPPGGEAFVESLNRCFGNVRAALQGPEGSRRLAGAGGRSFL